MANLYPAETLLVPAVQETIKSLDLDQVDAAAVKLAEQYALAIDKAIRRPEALEKFGPKLLAVLESLGATPAARARAKGGVANAPTNELDRLRAARR